MSQQPDIDTASVEQLEVMVGLATKGCFCWHLIAKDEEAPQEDCSQCDGTGRVWALPGAQEECPHYFAVANYTEGVGLTLRACRQYQTKCRTGQDECHGTGYVAKCGVEALLEAALTLSPIGVDFWLPPGYEDHIVRCNLHPASAAAKGESSKQALLRAVAKALVAKDCQLGKVSDG